VIELLNQLKKLAYRGHYTCEDPWYSCPLSEDGCANDAAGDECNCWAMSNEDIQHLLEKIGKMYSDQSDEIVRLNQLLKDRG
jgi:hypothetical protein